MQLFTYRAGQVLRGPALPSSRIRRHARRGVPASSELTPGQPVRARRSVGRGAEELRFSRTTLIEVLASGARFLR
jgi:hypothetical protein